jgi:hypothetical protein
MHLPAMTRICLVKAVLGQNYLENAKVSEWNKAWLSGKDVFGK